MKLPEISTLLTVEKRVINAKKRSSEPEKSGQNSAFALFYWVLTLDIHGKSIFENSPQKARKPAWILKKMEWHLFRHSIMVLVTGLEPVRYCYRGILSPLRLPVPPHQRHWLSNRMLIYNTTFDGVCQDKNHWPNQNPLPAKTVCNIKGSRGIPASFYAFTLLMILSK